MTMASSTGVPSTEAITPHNGFSLISNEKLLELYSAMLKCRMLQTRIRAMAKEDPTIRAEAVGEALVAGLCVELQTGDTLAPGLRGFAASFIKGLPLGNILAARSPAGSRPQFRYAAINLVPPSFGLEAQLNRALAVARANKASRNKKIVVAFCGESITAPDLLHEVMRQAGKRKLAMLFVYNSAPDAEEICIHARDCGFPGVTVDGADAVAVYRVATEAMTHARRGSGPTLVECKPWVHAGQKAIERRRAVDAILRMEEYLVRKRLFDKKFKASVMAQFRKELDDAMQNN